jgi:hypothetical protein
MEWVWVFIAICTFAGQVWAFRCWQELRKLSAELDKVKRSEEWKRLLPGT